MAQQQITIRKFNTVIDAIENEYEETTLQIMQLMKGISSSFRNILKRIKYVIFILRIFCSKSGRKTTLKRVTNCTIQLQFMQQNCLLLENMEQLSHRGIEVTNCA